jgi:(hydroxyamino)benzene mutase
VPLTPYPQLAVGAHVQFETNGLMFVLLGTLPIAAREAGAMRAGPRQENIVNVCHVVAALGLVFSWALMIVGFVRHDATNPSWVTPAKPPPDVRPPMQ